MDHESFIDSLIERNLVLMGGTFGNFPVPGVTAAYVLRCSSEAEAAEIVAEDPLVSSGGWTPIIVSWDLVAINTAAIDPGLASQGTKP